MRVILMIFAIALSACQPTPSGAPQAVTVQSGSILNLLNAARSAQGRAPVTENARLSQAARSHAQDMVDNGYFSHVGRDGSSFSERARAAGYSCAAAENIAAGQRSEGEVMAEWMNSSGHRRNILLADATEYGIGRVGTMWVLMMGRGC